MNAIKIVPDNDPNADGAWVRVADAYHMNTPIKDWEFTFGHYVPVHHHIVAVTSRYEEEL